MCGLYDSLCNMAFILFLPCFQDDYFLYSLILPVHHIHCLKSIYQLCLTLILSFRMSQGTRAQLGRNQGGRNDPEGSELPPPPTMAQVLMEVDGTAETLITCWKS